MEPISKSRFSELMASLRATFTRNEMTLEQVAVYYAFLKHIPERELEAAIHHLIGTRISPIFPTVGEIKLLAEGKAKVDVQVKALEAWRKASLYLTTGQRDDPILNEAIKLAFGSWAAFGNTEPDNDFDHHRFVEAYQIVLTDDARFGELRQLAETKKPLALGE